jgi:3-phosphoshikimate 1-carboxyvinyltransferase
VFEIDAAESSQFASSLAFGAAALHRREGRPWTVRILGEMASEAYFEMTLRHLEQGGFQFKRTERSIEICAFSPQAELPPVPGDWSSLGYLLPIAWRAGGTVAGVDELAEHPDRAIARLLRESGLVLKLDAKKEMSVRGQLRGGLVALGDECPDLLPTLAAIACVLPKATVLNEVEVLRGKESDRLEGIRALVAAAGGTTKLKGSSLTLTPPQEPAKVLRLHSRNDHRMAMAAATLAILLDRPLELEEPECVEKSFPTFWEQLAHAGVQIRNSMEERLP